MQIGGPGRPQVRRGAGWGYGLSGSQWERVSILRAVDPQVWLRAVRVAERGRDGRVKIAGKSALKLGAVPRPRLPSASPLKTRFYVSPLAPTVPSAPGLPLCPPWWRSTRWQKPPAPHPLPLGSIAHRFSAGLGIAHPLPRPILSSLLKYSHTLFSSSRPSCQDLSRTPTLLFPAPYSPPVLAFLPNPGRPLCAPSLPGLPRFPKPGAPREQSLRYKRYLGIAQPSPPPPSPSLDPSLDNLSSFAWRILNRKTLLFFLATQPSANNLPPFQPLFLSFPDVISHPPEGKLF